jgi:transketolase
MSLVEKGQALEDDWRRRFEAWRAAHPALAEDWDQAHTGKLRPGWAEALPAFDPAAKPKLATRAAGSRVMECVKPFVPTMVGGAADLVESTRTAFDGAGVFSRHFAGRNVPFGVREHAMGAIVNGLALHGGIVKPYGSTFLVFSDYMRPAVRLSALMNLPVVWAWTHDSVGLGEDGPTHQPVEHVAALRAIPNLWVIRPADANETTYAWKVALEREEGPVALMLSRQDLPVLERGEGHCAPAAGVERGAYVLWESTADAVPDLLLASTGSEVWVALEAAKTLAEDGLSVRVVSMPCWELFAAEAQEYRDEVLPPGVAARLAIEPGVELGWHRWVGDRGGVVGLERFGESAPGTEVLERLGYTVDNVVARATALLERVS